MMRSEFQLDVDVLTFVIISVYFPEQEEERPPEEVQQTPPPEPDNDYLGENVNDDVHN